MMHWFRTESRMPLGLELLSLLVLHGNDGHVCRNGSGDSSVCVVEALGPEGWVHGE